MVKFGNKCVLPECRSAFFGPVSTHIFLIFVNNARDDCVVNIHLCRIVFLR